MKGEAVIARTQSISAQFVAGAAAVSPTILKLAQDDTRSVPIHVLESTISSDPEFSLRLLGLANSAFYSQLHTIASLRSALVVLGAETVGRLAASLLSRALLSNPRHSDSAIWRHAQTTGIAAQMIAEAHRQVDPQQAFVAGLLHDIGVSAILAYGDSSADFELHAEIGAEVAEQLGLAPSLVSAIRLHDVCHRDAVADALIATVSAANDVAIRAGYCHDAESAGSKSGFEAALDHLGLEHSDVDAVLGGLARRLEVLETELGFQDWGSA